MNLYYDSEFTGLHQTSTLISMAFVADDGREFYAEFNDYSQEQCDEWIQKNVLHHTRWINDPLVTSGSWTEKNTTCSYGNSKQNRQAFTDWLAHYDQVEVWADCLAWDWVLLCELYGGALQKPEQIFYMPFDLVTLFKIQGLNPDTDREEFAALATNGGNQGHRHNALHDARVVQACYHKLLAGDQQG